MRTLLQLPRRLYRALLHLGRALLVPVVWLGRSSRRLAVSFRFWVLVILAFLITVVAYYVAADRWTPLTTDAFIQAYVVQVAPQVGGQVDRVHVREGQQVQAGQLLFELDARPFQHKVALLKARQVEIGQQVKQLATDLAAAEADQKRLEAEAAYAKAVHAQEHEIYKAESTTERRYLDAVQKRDASQAALQKAIQMVKHADEALAARIGGEHALDAQVGAQLAEAELNRLYCRVVAPCDGIVTDLQLRDGAYAHVGQAVLSVIDTRQWWMVANLRENSLALVREGQPALVALQGAPGQLLPAHVETLGWGVGQGQGVPSGLLPDVKRESSWVRPAQRFQVRLLLEDGEPVPLRVGMTGSVSIYVQPEGTLNHITRGLHQFIAWLYYL
jgi:multidrug resistance efflux pump